MKTIDHAKNLFTVLLLATFFSFSFTGCASPSSTEPIEEENIDTCQITIPGISKEYTLLYLTDTHIILPETEASQEIKEYSGNRLSQFTEENGVISSDLFLSWISYANENKLDALLLGGDIIDSPSPANIEYLGNSLEKLKIPYLYTLGNHDWTYPWEYMTEKGSNDYLPLLSPYMKNYTAEEYSSTGNTAIHSLELDDFIVVAVDNSNNQIHPNALEEYKTVLQKGKPVILLLHVPLYTESLLSKTSSVWSNGVVLGGGVHGGIYPNDISAEFIGLTTAKDSPVAAVVTGHVHLPDVSPIQGEKEIPQITGDAGFKGKGTIIHISP